MGVNSTMFKRRFERVSFFCKLELTPLPHGAPAPAQATDLSLGGVGAVAQANLQVGQLTTVTFYFNDPAHGELQDQAVGRVVHFDADVDSNKIGIQFLSPLSEVEHPRLIDRLSRI